MCGLSPLVRSQEAETSMPSPIDVTEEFVNSTPTVADRGFVKSALRSAPKCMCTSPESTMGFGAFVSCSRL